MGSRLDRLVLPLALAAAAGCAAPGAGSAGDDTSVLDLTWGWGWDRATGGEQYEAVSAVQRAEKLDYYRDVVHPKDAGGRPLKPLDQVAYKPNAVSNAPTGEPAKPAVFLDPSGGSIRIEDFRGRKNLVLVFTRGFPGYICPLCTTYTAQIASRYRDIAATETEVLVVFPGGRDKVEAFLKAARAILEEEGPGALPFPVVLDTELRNVDLFGIRGDLSKPATYILDREGKVRYAFVGDQPHERPDMDTIVTELRRLGGAKGK